MNNETSDSPAPHAGAAKQAARKVPPRKPWPLSWVLIAILAYLLLQVTWIAFHK